MHIICVCELLLLKSVIYAVFGFKKYNAINSRFVFFFVSYIHNYFFSTYIVYTVRCTSRCAAACFIEIGLDCQNYDLLSKERNKFVCYSLAALD